MPPGANIDVAAITVALLQGNAIFSKFISCSGADSVATAPESEALPYVTHALTVSSFVAY